MKKTLAYVLFLIVLIAPSTAFQYDKKHGTIKEFHGVSQDHIVDLSESVVRIFTIGTGMSVVPIWNEKMLKHEYKKVSGTFAISGTGFVEKGGRIITAAHVVMPDIIEVQVAKYVFYQTRLLVEHNKVIHIGNTNQYLVSAKIVWIDQILDMAILEVIGNWIAQKPLGYDLAQTLTITERGRIDLLTKDDAISIITYKRENDQLFWYHEVRNGKVLAIKPIACGGEIDALPFFNLHDITSDVIVYPGDSGAPVFAFKNGVPVIVGIVRAFMVKRAEEGVVEYHSYFVRIDKIILALMAL